MVPMKRLRTFLLMLIAATSLHGGYAQNLEFDNPIAEQRADPWVHKTDDGLYYLIATVPAYDRIVIRKSNTINGLKRAEEKVVWRKHQSGPMSYHIWAPELHRIDGKWYIYFAAGEAENIWNIRMWVLSNPSDNPMEGEWTEEGRIYTQMDSFSLDATTFEHRGKRYLIWAQNIEEGGHKTALVLSEMKNPTTLTGPEIVITEPDFSWEKRKYLVNEGAAVIKRDGRIFVTYSASATNHYYCLGLLWIDEDADLLDAASWQKSPGPVFHTNESLNRFGPGHNSFTVAEDGETVVMIYHARDYKEIEGHELSDPNRATRARAVRWTDDGFPDFRQYDE
jgi:GH43 family beta-xylosidase